MLIGNWSILIFAKQPKKELNYICNVINIFPKSTKCVILFIPITFHRKLAVRSGSNLKPMVCFFFPFYKNFAVRIMLILINLFGLWYVYPFIYWFSFVIWYRKLFNLENPITCRCLFEISDVLSLKWNLSFESNSQKIMIADFSCYKKN